MCVVKERDVGSEIANSRNAGTGGALSHLASATILFGVGQRDLSLTMLFCKRNDTGEGKPSLVSQPSDNWLVKFTATIERSDQVEFAMILWLFLIY